jgi:cell wall-associated NlpC family hydrolase
MKKLFVLFLLLVSFSFYGCSSVNISETQPILPIPPVNVEQDTTEKDEEFGEQVPDDEIIDEEENRRKIYAVSKVNGLRIRLKPNTSATVIGTLNQNDAVLVYEQKNGFYKTIYKEQTAYVWADYCSTFEVEHEDERIEKAIDFGSTLLGYPYVWGSQRYHWGNGKLNSNFVNGEFDCSALVQYVYFKSNGVILDLTSRAQSLNGVEIKRQELKRGDLLFFTNASRKNKVGIERIGHVGIYFGNNYILHTASDYAVIEPISDTRWSYYITARRVV